MEVRGKRIFVGLSGGVDSAVSAALLQEQEAEVVGVFIKGWYPPGMPCTWAADRQDAMRVAARLRIPFRTLDASAEYKREVIDYLLAEYAAGRTPNPDAMCNREIKFGTFYRYAMDAGADAIATGHYRSGEKDQSYFLALVPGEVLAKTIFPVGSMEKGAVRPLARRFNLPVAQKKDSQGVCFLGSISVKEFLERELGSSEAILRTIGERVDGKYVVGKEEGKLILADTPAPLRQGSAGQAPQITFHSANWLGDTNAVTHAQLRYRSKLIPGHIQDNHFIPAQPLDELPVPGQLIAFYAADQCAGGGIIAAYA
jgi:tRNA (5-methylaminomethyl-2-thiouridylate)-methyltransferase